MKVHPVCDIFPEMSRDQFAGLSRDIAANGQREPIVTWQGQIIDGRHREKACRELGIEPCYREWDGQGDLVTYIVALNLHRRHMDESQLSMVADRIANYKQGDNKKSETANLPFLPVTHSQAAQMVNVSERLVRSASIVRNRGVPELAEMVEKGKVKVSAAEEVARLPEPVQESVVQAGPAAVKKMAAERRNARKAAPAPRKRSKPVPQTRASDEFWASIKLLLKDMVGRRDEEDLARLRELRDQINAVLGEPPQLAATA